MIDSMEIIYITLPTNSDRFYKFTKFKSIKTTYNLQGHVGKLGFGRGYSIKNDIYTKLGALPKTPFIGGALPHTPFNLSNKNLT